VFVSSHWSVALFGKALVYSLLFIVFKGVRERLRSENLSVYTNLLFTGYKRLKTPETSQPCVPAMVYVVCCVLGFISSF